MWSEEDFEGEFREVFGPNDQVGRCYSPEINWLDGTRSTLASFKNRSDYQVQVYDSETCTGPPYGIVKPGGKGNNISGRLHSFRITPVCDPGCLCFFEKKNYTGKKWRISPRFGSVCNNATARGAEPPLAAYNMLGGPVTLFFSSGGWCLGGGTPWTTTHGPPSTSRFTQPSGSRLMDSPVRRRLTARSRLLTCRQLLDDGQGRWLQRGLHPPQAPGRDGPASTGPGAMPGPGSC
ncbi:hypothetical protein ACGF8B_40125 [Streptomyces sp. NPDC047917]|uniref:hypothetical protein n=1 Tax=Streptomyces sp. NPDC047917 TaxID=3365491 RepID=UPI003710BCE0